MPKPLIPVLNESLLAIALRQLGQAGFRSFAVNAHYMVPAIQEFVDAAKKSGLDIRVSIELPQILGTGGAFMPLRTWLGHESFMVYNGDLLSDIAFLALKERHRSEKNLVTMALRPGHNGKDLAVWGTIVGQAIRVHDIEKTAPSVPGIMPYTYACAYMADPKLLEFLPPTGESFVIDGMVQGLKSGLTITGLVHEGFWADLGTPQTLFSANSDLLASSPETQARILGVPANEIHAIHLTAHIAKSAHVDAHTVIGAGSVVGEGANVQKALLLAGSTIAPGETICRMICGPNGLRVRL